MVGHLNKYLWVELNLIALNQIQLKSVLVRILQRNRISRILLILRNRLTWLWAAGKSKICRLQTQGRADVAAWVQRWSTDRIPSSSVEIGLFSLKAFNWLNEAESHYGE